MFNTSIRIGLDLFEKNWQKNLRDSRVGLLVHPASVNKKLNHAVNLFIKSKKFGLKTLFGPQHGIRGETQDNMVEWEGLRAKETGRQEYSLYGRTRKPDKGTPKEKE